MNKDDVLVQSTLPKMFKIIEEKLYSKEIQNELNMLLLNFLADTN